MPITPKLFAYFLHLALTYERYCFLLLLMLLLSLPLKLLLCIVVIDHCTYVRHAAMRLERAVRTQRVNFSLLNLLTINSNTYRALSSIASMKTSKQQQSEQLLVKKCKRVSETKDLSSERHLPVGDKQING